MADGYSGIGIWRSMKEEPSSNNNNNNNNNLLSSLMASGFQNNGQEYGNNNNNNTHGLAHLLNGFNSNVGINPSTISNNVIAANLSNNGGQQTPSQTHPAGPGNLRKRGHVSKACTNCRKMHAGCDKERPCARCVFNGWEETCVDTPRKKRVSKKPKSNERCSLKGEGQVRDSCDTPVLTTTFQDSASPSFSMSAPPMGGVLDNKPDNSWEKIWPNGNLESINSDLFNEIYNDNNFGNRSEDSNRSSSEDDSGPLNFLPESLLLTATDIINKQKVNSAPLRKSASCGSSLMNGGSMFGSNNFAISVDVTQMPAPSGPSSVIATPLPNNVASNVNANNNNNSNGACNFESNNMNSIASILNNPAPTSNSSSSSGFITRREVSLLVKEITELRDKNLRLEMKLDTVTQELSDLKDRHTQLVNIVSTILLPSASSSNMMGRSLNISQSSSNPNGSTNSSNTTSSSANNNNNNHGGNPSSNP